MKNSANSQRGPALASIVLVVFTLVLTTGVAIHGGDGCCMGPGRHPQNGADTAALAAALCRIHGNKDCTQRAYDMAAVNGFPNDGVRSQVEVYTCDMAQARCGSYAGNPDYIQVILTAYTEPFSTRLLTNVLPIRQRERVEAIALAQPPDKVSLWHSDSRIPGTGRTWVFSAPAWLQAIPEPYRLVLLLLIGAMILGLPLLIRRIWVKPM